MQVQEVGDELSEAVIRSARDARGKAQGLAFLSGQG
jgi:hypothetical protein